MHCCVWCPAQFDNDAEFVDHMSSHMDVSDEPPPRPRPTTSSRAVQEEVEEEADGGEEEADVDEEEADGEEADGDKDEAGGEEVEEGESEMEQIKPDEKLKKIYPISQPVFPNPQPFFSQRLENDPDADDSSEVPKVDSGDGGSTGNVTDGPVDNDVPPVVGPYAPGTVWQGAPPNWQEITRSVPGQKAPDESRQDVWCHLCRKYFATVASLRRHLRVHVDPFGNVMEPKGPKGSEFECIVCGKKYLRNALLRKHMLNHDSVAQLLVDTGGVDGAYPCHFCGQVYTRPERLKYHLLTHSRKQYHCFMCDTSFWREKDLLKHALSCNMSCCGEVVGADGVDGDTEGNTKDDDGGNSASAGVSMKKNPKDYLGYIDVTGNVVGCRIEDLPEPLEDGRYPCKICGKSFFPKSLYLRHQVAHSGVKGHQCPRCNKWFGRRDHMKAHIGGKNCKPDKTQPELGPSGVAPVKTPPILSRMYRCPICKERFTNKMDFHEHRNSCTAELLQGKAKKYSDLTDLEKLQNNASDDNITDAINLSVNVDNSGVAQDGSGVNADNEEESLGRKKRRRGRPCEFDGDESLVYPCPSCDQVFSDIAVLNQHYLIHTGSSLFQCQWCGKTFGLKKYLLTHMKDTCKKNPGLLDKTGEGYTLAQDWAGEPYVKKKRKYSIKKIRKIHREPDYSIGYTCVTCDKLCQTRTGFIQHLRRVHDLSQASDLPGGQDIKIADDDEEDPEKVNKEDDDPDQVQKAAKGVPDQVSKEEDGQDEVQNVGKNQFKKEEDNLDKVEEEDDDDPDKAKNEEEEEDDPDEVRKEGEGSGKIAHSSKFICATCKKTFTTQEHLEAHVKRFADNDLELACRICHVLFQSDSAMVRHNEEHELDDTYKIECPVCGKGFKRYAHFVTHSQSTQYYHCSRSKQPCKCKRCGEEMPFDEYLRHVRLHEGLATYCCPQCNEKYLHPHAFLKHQRKCANFMEAMGYEMGRPEPGVEPSNAKDIMDKYPILTYDPQTWVRHRIYKGPWLLRNFNDKIHIRWQRFSNMASDWLAVLRNFIDKIHISWQRFSNMASDWLAAVPPANQKPGSKILATNMDFNIEIFSVIQAPGSNYTYICTVQALSWFSVSAYWLILPMSFGIARAQALEKS